MMIDKNEKCCTLNMSAKRRAIFVETEKGQGGAFHLLAEVE
jgi:hypothetical protein